VEGQSFLYQFSRGPQPSKSMLCICLVVLLKLIVLSLPLLYLVVLEASFSLGTFLCCSSLRKCSTSDLLNLQNCHQFLKCFWTLSHQMVVQLSSVQCLYVLRDHLVIRHLQGICFEAKEPPEKVGQ
jgi:hypothetical protein